MISPASLQCLLLTLATVVGFCASVLAVCKSDGGYACPAQDDIAPVLGPYDPATVDWNAVVADVYAITDSEPRICTMAIRTWFHDVGSHEPLDDGPGANEEFFPGIGGSDASILTHKDETLEHENAFHGFAQVAKHVLVQLAAAHGASHADMLTVFAAMCPNRMSATVNIPAHCEAAGFPLYVGKEDYSRPTEHSQYPIHTLRADQLPQAHTRIPPLYKFFLEDINEQIPEARWKLTQEDATSLMGAHGMMQNQNCMTDGIQPGSAPGMTDRTCSGGGGTQRMFKWSNHYWQDVSSGSCRQTPFNKAGRSLNTQESAEFTQCSWNSMEGFALGERLECDAMKVAEQRLSGDTLDGQPAIQFHRERGDFSEGWKDALWLPDDVNPPAPCCGYTCQTCEVDPGSKFWCGNYIKDEARFWPYGYLDCDWQRAMEEGAAYCDGELGAQCPSNCDQCANHWPGKGPQIRSIMGNVKGILDKYRGSADAWQGDFAVAFCKFSNFGAQYSEGKTSFASLFSGPSTGCLDVASVLSPKQCPTCEIAGRDPSMMRDADPIGGNPTQPVTPPSTPVAPAAAPVEVLPAAAPVDVVDTTTTNEVPVEPLPAVEKSSAVVEATTEASIVEEPEPVVEETEATTGTQGATGGDPPKKESTLYKWMSHHGYWKALRRFF